MDNPFTTIKNQAITDSEKKGIDMLFKMMLYLRQQIVLRRKLLSEKERENNG